LGMFCVGYIYVYILFSNKNKLILAGFHPTHPKKKKKRRS
jgi:hypothetical protein